MGLKDKLDEIRERTLVNPEIRTVYDDVMRHLGAGESAAAALQPGQPMPAFMLPDSEGRLVASDDLLARGPLVVSFFRGDWCPYCRTMLEAYEAARPEIVAAGGQLVAITPDTGAIPARTRRERNLHFAVLSDAESGVALQFGVTFRLPDSYRALLVSRGADLSQRHGNDGWLVPIPGTFVVDRAGIVRATFVDIDFTRRADPDRIVAALRSL